MNDETIGTEGRDGRQSNASEGVAIGQTVKEARQAANIDANKLCADLRISPQVLEALEQGNYHLLSGDPYIRALLGSIGRYLNLDPISLVQRYNKEIGAVHAAPSIAPYKDRTQTHTATHKQIFIGIFVLLFVVLFLLFRKLNVSDSDSSKAATLPAHDSTSETLAPAAQDTLLESKSLAPDSSLAKASPDSGETRGLGATSRIAGPSPIKPPVPGAPAVPAAPGLAAAAPGTSAKPMTAAVQGTPGKPLVAAVPGSPSAQVPSPANAPIDSSHLTLAVVKPLIDSVGVKVMRSGKEDFATMLRLGKQMQVSHTDTIVIAISKRKAVEVSIGGKNVIPDRKRFKIYGTTLKTF